MALCWGERLDPEVTIFPALELFAVGFQSGPFTLLALLC